MSFSSGPGKPIVVGTPFKSGTWLIRKIISDMTGLPWFEPALYKNIAPEDPANVLFEQDKFYSWHFIPSEEIRRKLVESDVRCVFIVRNIYAMTLSMYHHFSENIDWEIGRAANQVDLFRALSKDDGIKRIIRRESDDGFNWRGIELQIRQIYEMLDFAESGFPLLLTYEQLLFDKRECVKKLAAYFSIELDELRIAEICESSEFSIMKESALKQSGGSHFKSGQAYAYHELISGANRYLIEQEIERVAPQLPLLAKKLGISFIVDWDNLS